MAAPRETPVQETVEIRNKGSYTIPLAARRAHRCLIDVEIISVTRPQYYNFLYNLPQGDYANFTLWSGASIRETVKIKYPAQRILDWVNIEAGMQHSAALVAAGVGRSLNNLAVQLGFIPFPLPNSPDPSWGLLISHVKVVCPEDTQLRITCQWYPFIAREDVATPDPDLDDPAEGEDEYPEPKKNPVGDPWQGNPDPSGPDPNRDPRDSSPDNVPPPPPPPPNGGIAGPNGAKADRSGTPVECTGGVNIINIPAGASWQLVAASSTCGSYTSIPMAGYDLEINGQYSGWALSWTVSNNP